MRIGQNVWQLAQCFHTPAYNQSNWSNNKSVFTVYNEFVVNLHIIC